MPLIWQHTFMKKDLKCSLMPSQKWRSFMPQSSSQQWLSHLPWSTNCQTKKIVVSNVGNQAMSHKIALLLDTLECNKYGHIVMDFPHRIPPSGTPATHHKLDKSHHARSSLRHHCEVRDRQSQSRLQSHFQRHCSLSHHSLHRGCSRSQHWDRHSHHRSSSWWSHSVHRGHSHYHRSHHDKPHQSHRISFQHQSSSGYQSWDHSRSHLWPSYKSSRHGSWRSGSQSSRTRRQTHHKKDLKVKIEDPHTDYYSSDDNSSDLGEGSESLN